MTETAGNADELFDDDDRANGNKARFLVSLGKPQLAALRLYAAKKGLSVSEVVRRAVDDFLDNQNVVPPT